MIALSDVVYRPITAAQYNAADPQASHYTQVVWKGTQQVGCGMAPFCADILGVCSPFLSNPECSNDLFQGAKYFVCEYFPAGNVLGEFG